MNRRNLFSQTRGCVRFRRQWPRLFLAGVMLCGGLRLPAAEPIRSPDSPTPGLPGADGDSQRESGRQRLVAAAASVPAAQPEGGVLFEDSFDAGLGEGWGWLREKPDRWRIRDGALEIRLEPGNAQTVQNALVRPAPDRAKGKFAIEVTVTNLDSLTQQYEQAGITWYVKGEPVFKLVKELVDGQLMIIPGRKPMASKTVRLRLEVTANSFAAQYQPDAKGEFQTAATGELPAPQLDQVSLQGYHGPADAEHWVRFDDFRILEIAE